MQEIAFGKAKKPEFTLQLCNIFNKYLDFKFLLFFGAFKCYK